MLRELAIGSSVFTDNRRVLLSENPNMIILGQAKKLFISLLKHKLEEFQKIQITLKNRKGASVSTKIHDGLPLPRPG